jgi:hypothetical protein
MWRGRDELASAKGENSAAHASLSSLFIKDPKNALMVLEACAATCQLVAESHIRNMGAAMLRSSTDPRHLMMRREPCAGALDDVQGGSRGEEPATESLTACEPCGPTDVCMSATEPSMQPNASAIQPMQPSASAVQQLPQLGTQAGVQVLPWDLSYAQQLLLGQACPLITSELLTSPCMDLQHVLKVMDPVAVMSVVHYECIAFLHYAMP